MHVTRSRKRAPVGITYLESPPLVTVPTAVAVRAAWRSVGVDVRPTSSPQRPASSVPPPSDTWPGFCHDDDDIVPPPVPSIRHQKRPRVAAIPPPVPCEPNVHAVPAAAAACIPPPAHNVPLPSQLHQPELTTHGQP